MQNYGKELIIPKTLWKGWKGGYVKERGLAGSSHQIKELAGGKKTKKFRNSLFKSQNLFRIQS